MYSATKNLDYIAIWYITSWEMHVMDFANLSIFSTACEEIVLAIYTVYIYIYIF